MWTGSGDSEEKGEIGGGETETMREVGDKASGKAPGGREDTLHLKNL